MTDALQVHRGGEMAPPPESPIFPLFSQAIEKGAEGAGALATLYELYKEERADARRVAFARAFAKFQAECPFIPRTSVVDYTSKSGTRVKYNFSSLETMMATIGPHARRNGFSISFDTEIAQNAKATILCHITHELGHRETSRFTLPTTSQSPGMSEQQAMAGALKFGMRHALIAALGLSTEDPDPIGEGESDPTTISEDQAADLRSLADDVGADHARFLRFMGVESFDAIRVAEYGRAVAALNEKRAKR